MVNKTWSTYSVRVVWLGRGASVLYTYASLLPSPLKYICNLHAETTRLAHRINAECGISVHSAELPISGGAFLFIGHGLSHSYLSHYIPRFHPLISSPLLFHSIILSSPISLVSTPLFPSLSPPVLPSLLLTPGRTTSHPSYWAHVMVSKPTVTSELKLLDCLGAWSLNWLPL